MEENEQKKMTLIAFLVITVSVLLLVFIIGRTIYQVSAINSNNAAIKNYENETITETTNEIENEIANETINEISNETVSEVTNESYFYENYMAQEIFETEDKPIIYLYPTKDTRVNVKLGKAELATCLYPKYDFKNGWNVLAKPDGNLIDMNTNRNLYSLYYESKTAYNFKVENEGFIVKGTEVAEFLEKKLEILGLTERESEEFIVYWLPKLQSNKYNYIRFANEDEINMNMPLEINPRPDSIVRVLMTFKGLDEPIYVIEQELETPARTGFVVAEWGGTEIK